MFENSSFVKGVLLPSFLFLPFFFQESCSNEAFPGPAFAAGRIAGGNAAAADLPSAGLSSASLSSGDRIPGKAGNGGKEAFLPVYAIQGEGSVSPHDGLVVETEGVVTLTLFEEGQLNGFFLQDTAGDGKPETSDALFVYGRQDVAPGDYVRVRGKVGEYRERTQMSAIESVEVLGQGIPIPFATVRFPEDIQGKEESLECMALEIPDTLHVIGTRELQREGRLVLGSTRHRSPTDYREPGSEEYHAAVAFNASDRLLLDDGSSSRPQTLPFMGEDGSWRTGRFLAGLKCVFDQVDEQYVVYAQEGEPAFSGNPRTEVPPFDELGDCDARICGFNLEYFMNESDLQRTRIVKALSAIDADIYGLVEVGGGSEVIGRLVEELNAAKGSEVYDFVKWSGYEPASDYTLNHIVYDKTVWEPYRDYYMINTPSPYNRKLIQALRHKQNGFVFIFSINHFKAKSGNGSGADADQGDGQGAFNATRVKEAYAVRDKLDLVRYYYGTEHVLVMGDLNALYREDPIRVFTDAGYEEQVHRFHSDSYSYCFDDGVQYLDYALASPALASLVTGAAIWHINSDEPSFFDYERGEGGQGPYRSSDHDPVIVGLSFEPVAGNRQDLQDGGGKGFPRLQLYPNPASGRFSFEAGSKGEVEVFSASGLRLWQGEVSAGRVELDAGSWAEGVYFVFFRTEAGQVFYGKLLHATGR